MTAHAVSVIVIQAGAVEPEPLVEERPEEAREALRSIRATASEVLAELRRQRQTATGRSALDVRERARERGSGGRPGRARVRAPRAKRRRNPGNGTRVAARARRDVGTIPAHMRDDSLDTVTPGGQPAPLGARGGRGAPAGGRAATPSIARIGLSARLLLALLGLALVAYAAVAADVVNAGRLSGVDRDIAVWVAGSMPTWAEWLARPFTWVGGVVGVTVLVAAATVWLLARRAYHEAALLLAVTLGIQVLVWTGKHGYERARPDLGSAIPLPSSSSFPSGHAATGIAVFGLFGILASTVVRTRRRRIGAICAGFALGALIGASRVVLNVHWLTDVLGGSLLGLAWLALCLLVAVRSHR